MKALAARDMRPGDGAGEQARRLVLAELARLDPRGDDAGDPGFDEPGNILLGEQAALAQRAPADADAVHEDGAGSLADRCVAKFHAARLALLHAVGAQDSGDLGEDRDGDLGRRERADRKPDRPVDPRQLADR